MTNSRAIRIESRYRLWDGAGVQWAVGSAWAIGVGAIHALEQASGRTAQLCLLKSLTGCPCPTCGSTRAALLLAHGDLAGAVALNPLTTALMVLLPLIALVCWSNSRFARRRTPTAERARRFRGGPLLVLGLVALAANWLYVIIHGV